MSSQPLTVRSGGADDRAFVLETARRLGELRYVKSL